jgi:hypothetical protein
MEGGGGSEAFQYRHTRDLNVRFPSFDPEEEEEVPTPRSTFPGQRAVDDIVSPRSSQVMPIISPMGGKVYTIKTDNVGKYYLNKHVPKLHGRVVDITPDTEGADSGPGLLRVEEDKFELRMNVQTPGVVDKPCEFSVTVESRTMAAFKSALLKQLKLPVNTRFTLSQRKKNDEGAEQWLDVKSVDDFKAGTQNIIRVRDRGGCKNVYKKWYATIDKTPSVSWPVSASANAAEQMAAQYVGTRYFQKPDANVVKNRKLIAIGIPAYNEQRHELRRTLESLNECQGYKLIDQNYGPEYRCPVTKARLEGYYTTAIIILDGLKATSGTMQVETVLGVCCLYAVCVLYSVLYSNVRHYAGRNSAVCCSIRYSVLYSNVWDYAGVHGGYIQHTPSPYTTHHTPLCRSTWRIYSAYPIHHTPLTIHYAGVHGGYIRHDLHGRASRSGEDRSRVRYNHRTAYIIHHIPYVIHRTPYTIQHIDTPYTSKSTRHSSCSMQHIHPLPHTTHHRYATFIVERKPLPDGELHR